MKTLELYFDLEPVAKGRPRFGKGHAYTPEKTREFEKWMKHMAKEMLPGFKPITGPIILSVVVHKAIPKSWSKKLQELAANGLIHAMGKPDMSNFMKGIEDALNGVVWTDDGQIIGYGNCWKIYSNRPHIDVVVQEIT